MPAISPLADRPNGPDSSPAPIAWPWPRWFAHRGAGRQAPENTLAAFRTGLAKGWRAFECDVRLSADGVPFLLHDDTLDRTTNGHGPAGALDWAALSRLDAGGWHSPAHAGERLPRLADVAALLQPAGAALNIEIKPAPGTEAATGRAVALAAQALWQGRAPPLLSSFRPAALAAARAAAPALPRALLLDALPADWLAQAQALDCMAVVVQHRLIDARLLALAHGAGLQVASYTVNHRRTAQRLWALGVQALISDEIDRFAPADV